MPGDSCLKLEMLAFLCSCFQELGREHDFLENLELSGPGAASLNWQYSKHT